MSLAYNPIENHSNMKVQRIMLFAFAIFILLVNVQAQDCNCNAEGSKNLTCDANTGQCDCKCSIEGLKCDACTDLHYNFPDCENFPCNCNENGSTSLICNKETGQCPCKPNVIGRQCEVCENGYKRHPDCTPCNCNVEGSNGSTCSNSGQCGCKDNVEGLACDHCKPGYFGFPTCESCGCNEEGSDGLFCNSNGVCVCKGNFIGNKCDQCKSGFTNYPKCDQCAESFFGYPNCKPCLCLEVGSKNSSVCDSVTGACECHENIGGRDCDNCENGFFEFPVCKACECACKGTVDGNDSCDNEGKCVCKPGYAGDKCDRCENGFHFKGKRLLTECKACDCNFDGVNETNSCDSKKGRCNCKENVMGQKCDQCKNETFQFPYCKECECNLEGSLGPLCDNFGFCSCKNGYIGQNCDAYDSRSKLLVITGDTGDEKGRKGEVIDLADPFSICKPWVDFPRDVSSTTGKLIGGNAIVCGGYFARTHCYKIGPKTAVPMADLKIGRWLSSSAVFNNSLFVVGGWDSKYTNLKRTEYISEGGQEYGASNIVGVEGHCVIQLNSNEMLLTGGDYKPDRTTKDTYYFKHEQQQWKYGTPMLNARAYHGCGAFTLGDYFILIVAGGEKSDSVEFFKEYEWIEGPALPQKYSTFGHEIVTDGRDVYYLNTVDLVILRLDCPTDVKSCKWIKLQQKLSFPRKWALALLIPDDLTECSKNP